MKDYISRQNQNSTAIKERIDELIECYDRSSRKDIVMKFIMEWKDKYIIKLEEERLLCEN